jgi:orotidine-5'-phosphate decarboxylase
MTRHFSEILIARGAAGMFVCVGLDSDFERIPRSAHVYDFHDGGINVGATILEFNRRIVAATCDLAGAYKLNWAFYLAQALDGMAALHQTIDYIHQVAPEVPVILDAKVGDIGNTNAGYVECAFDYLKADAITVHPWLGAKAMQPFLARADKGVFVLCLTSNEGAGEFQDLLINRRPLYQQAALNVASSEWNYNHNCGVVVGATYPEHMPLIRNLIGDTPILIPGVGAQGGDLKTSVLQGQNSQKQGFIINSSRGIIFAPLNEGEDFADAARRETLKLHQAITVLLQSS